MPMTLMPMLMLKLKPMMIKMMRMMRQQLVGGFSLSIHLIAMETHSHPH